MGNFFRDIKTFFRTIAQLKRLLNRKQKIRAVEVFFLTFLGAAFETLGVAAILPFISAIMEPLILWENSYIKFLSNIFNIKTSMGLILFLGIVISGVYIVKNLFLLFVSYAEARFRAEFVYELSKMMMYSYLKRPYVYFLDTNSAEMMRGVSDDINSANELISAIFKICSLCLMMVGIGCFLIIQNPIMAAGMLILSFLVFLVIVSVVKKKNKGIRNSKIGIGYGSQ